MDKTLKKELVSAITTDNSSFNETTYSNSDSKTNHAKKSNQFKPVGFLHFVNMANKSLLLSMVFTVSMFYYACGQQQSQTDVNPVSDNIKSEQQNNQPVENNIPAFDPRTDKAAKDASKINGQSQVVQSGNLTEATNNNSNIVSNGLFSYYVTGNADEDLQNYNSAKKSFLESNPELTDYVNRLEEAQKQGKHFIDKNEFENMPQERQKHILKNKDKYLIN